MTGTDPYAGERLGRVKVEPAGVPGPSGLSTAAAPAG
jgi:hypothetical protein